MYYYYLSIEECFVDLIQVLDNHEQSQYNILTAYEEIKKINLKYDPLLIKSYNLQRLADNDIKSICEFENENCPPTPIIVERSFSKLKKILTIGRNFGVKNMANYINV